ncbi:hypothetical protein ANO11243_038000 [Dothideomycetidae sp. 11243]|nr:hypothetical protein ANO11243_038000 [fungal sp. No.11243]
MHNSILLTALVAGIATAAPATTATGSCTFTDAATAIKNKGSCTSITLAGIAVPAGTTLDMTNLKQGTTVTFTGTTTFGYKEWPGPLISVSGTDITVTGDSSHMIDFGGEQYWDGKGSNGGKTKPKAFFAHSLTDSTISDLNVKNTPVQFMSINGANQLYIKNVNFDNSAGASLGHNTDAFDVGSSTGVYISGASVHNQDDCLAINSGVDVAFVGGSCTGGHGLSIGSVGGRSDNHVQNVVIADNTISNSANGVRIKTVSGATGSIANVVYTNIKLSGITTYGVVIEQDYENGGPTGKPTNGVPITNLNLSGIMGSVASDATNVHILCGSGSCSNWKWNSVDVSGGKKSSNCLNVPNGATCT